MIKKWMMNVIDKISLLYAKLNHLAMTIMVLGLLEMGIYYELILSTMAILAPEFAPLIVVLFIWIAYRGIRRLYKNSKNKRYILI